MLGIFSEIKGIVGALSLGACRIFISLPIDCVFVPEGSQALTDKWIYNRICFDLL